MNIGFDFCYRLPFYLYLYKNNGEDGHTLIEKMTLNEALMEAEAYIEQGWDFIEAINANNNEVVFTAKAMEEDEEMLLTF